MFRKAQLKLFSIIMCILVSVFIALLGSLNIITKEVMERQSKVVLMKIAEGVEYNDKNSTFTFTRPDDMEPEHNKNDQPPPKPEETTSVQTTVTTAEETTSEEATSTDVTTDKKTEPEHGGEHEEPPEARDNNDDENEPDDNDDDGERDDEHEDETTPAVTQNKTEATTQRKTEAPTVQTTAKRTEAVTTQTAATQPPVQTTTTNAVPTFPDKPDDEDEPWKKHDPWEHDDDNKDYNWPKRDDEWRFQSDVEVQSNEDDIEPESYIGSADAEPADMVYRGEALLDGFTLVANTETTTQEQPPTGEVPPDMPPDGMMGGEPPFDEQRTEPVPKSLGSIEFFVIMANENGKFLGTLNNDDLSEEDAQRYITAILKEDVDTGMLNNYQFYKTDKSNGTLMVFTDKSAETDFLAQLKKITIIIGAASIILLSVAAYFLSKKSMQPIEIAFERQKQFVSDASHELKTPLTVISANADVLAGEIGENKWLTYIQSQTERMNVLVNDLLNLTRLENNTTDFIRTDFDLSKAVVNTALPFECQAFETNKKFEVDVDDGITVNGSERHIKQMAAIFIDNALKYSGEGGTVKVTLRKQGDKKMFSVYNTGQGVKDSEKDKIFERFYRSDESRNRSTGGYGLGLAIAKSIIDKHKFKVHVENQEGKSICFVVMMP